MQLQKAVDLFLQEQKARGNTVKTIQDYRQNLSYFIDYCGDVEVSVIDKNKIINYIVYLREKPKNLGHRNKKVSDDEFMSSVTIQSYVRHLKVFFVWLYENEFIEEDVAHKFRLPKASKKLKKILTEDEIELIFETCDSGIYALRNKLIISLMLYSGLRASEVVNLTLSSYDSYNRLLTVFGKGQKERIVPVGDYTHKLYKDYLIYRRLRSFINTLFIDYNNSPVTYNAVRLLVSRIGKRSGVKRLHSHLLRHTFATRYLIKTKGDITSLKAILGHTSLKMVENYLHLATSYSIGQYREFCN